MKLIESVAGDQPVALLIEAVEDHSVGQHLVQKGTALAACFVVESYGQLAHGTVALYLFALLIKQGLRIVYVSVGAATDLGSSMLTVRFRDFISLSGHENTPFVM